jgi:uncharacterized metal-binding protein YceD (DUF177 family)
MKIEFRKLPNKPKDFKTSFDSVEFSGTFCKISSALAKFETKLSGKIELQCCRCGDAIELDIDEEFNFLVSDRVYKNDESKDLIIELDNEIIDFDEIVKGEVASFQSEYTFCDACKDNESDFEKEY